MYFAISLRSNSNTNPTSSRSTFGRRKTAELFSYVLRTAATFNGLFDLKPDPNTHVLPFRRRWAPVGLPVDISALLGGNVIRVALNCLLALLFSNPLCLFCEAGQRSQIPSKIGEETKEVRTLLDASSPPLARIHAIIVLAHTPMWAVLPVDRSHCC